MLTRVGGWVLRWEGGGVAVGQGGGEGRVKIPYRREAM